MLFLKELFIDLISFVFWLFIRIKNIFVSKNVGFRALVYHATSNDIDKKDDIHQINVQPDLFIRQIEFLQKNGYEFIGLNRCLDIIKGKEKLAGKYILLTFDDALRSVLSGAFTFLKSKNLKGVLFVSTDYIDKGECLPWVRKKQLLKPMSWEDIRGIMDIMEIGSHAVTHRNIKHLEQNELEEEALRSRQRIAQETGAQAISFSYPFGFVDAFDEHCKEVLKQQGYTMAFCNVFGENKAGDDAFELKRMRISNSDRGFKLLMKMDGAYDWLDRLKAALYTHKKEKGND